MTEPTIAEARHILVTRRLAREGAENEPAEVRIDTVRRIFAEVESLSDDEVRRALAAESP